MDVSVAYQEVVSLYNLPRSSCIAGGGASKHIQR